MSRYEVVYLVLSLLVIEKTNATGIPREIGMMLMISGIRLSRIFLAVISRITTKICVLMVNGTKKERKL